MLLQNALSTPFSISGCISISKQESRKSKKRNPFELFCRSFMVFPLFSLIIFLFLRFTFGEKKDEKELEILADFPNGNVLSGGKGNKTTIK